MVLGLTVSKTHASCSSCGDRSLSGFLVVSRVGLLFFSILKRLGSLYEFAEDINFPSIANEAVLQQLLCRGAPIGVFDQAL